MTKFDRRQWLKSAGLAGSFAFFGGIESTAKSIESLEKKFNPRPLATPVRLSSNENPYGPSEKVRNAMQDNFDLGCRYPFSYSQELHEMIAEKEGVTTDHIVVTGGSTEGLRITGLTYGVNGGQIVAAKPTFLAMTTYASHFGADISWVPVDENMMHDLEAMDRRVTNNTSLVFLCNPNNPTSTLLPADKVMDFCQSVSNRAVVFSDEAYYDFIEDSSYPSMVELVKKDMNVIVSRTFSKVYGLAGIRIGYLIARPDIAARIRKNVVAYINILAISAAKAAMQDKEFYDHALKKNKEAKQYIYSVLDDLGLKYVPSHTNFVFFHSGVNINTLNAQMKEHGVLIGRPFPPFYDWCRISTGTMDEVKLFGEGLKKVMA